MPHPTTKKYARALVQALNRRFDAFDGEYLVLGRGMPMRHRAPPPRWLDNMLRWAAELRTTLIDAAAVLLVVVGALVVLLGIGSVVRAVCSQNDS